MKHINYQIPLSGKLEDFRSAYSIKRNIQLQFPNGYLWGYRNGKQLTNNKITAENHNVTSDNNGLFTFNSNSYFILDKGILLGNSPRTFCMNVKLSNDSRYDYNYFITAGGYQLDQCFQIFWSYDYIGYDFGYSEIYQYDDEYDEYFPVDTQYKQDYYWIELKYNSYLLFFVFDGNSIKVYKNKEVIGQFITTLNTTQKRNYHIGAWGGNWQSNFCLIYDRALTQSQINQIDDSINCNFENLVY